MTLLSALRELRIVGSLASIMAFRMLGLFMLLPVLTLYAHHFRGATSQSIGFAMGIYGLTQAIFQIPFGTLADRFGKKKIIALGLVLFLFGSLVAAGATTIEGLILGRALQGMGAIGSATMALIADLTHDEQRTRAMAVVGLAIGISFSIAMILGPMISHHYGLNGIFMVTAGFACVGLLLLIFVVPQAPHSLSSEKHPPFKRAFKQVISDPQLLRLDFGIASLHAILTIVFLAMPTALRQHAGLNATEQTKLYLVALPIAFVLMLPIIILAEKKKKLKIMMLSSIATLVGITFLFALTTLTPHSSTWELGGLLLVFFIAFSALEAMLPSMISKLAPIRHKASAMGVYSSVQFTGIFLGGWIGGFVLGHFSLAGVFLLASLLALLWISIALGMKEPPHLSTLTFVLEHHTPTAHELSQLDRASGVEEVHFSQKENALYLKVDKTRCNLELLYGQIEALKIVP